MEEMITVQAEIAAPADKVWKLYNEPKHVKQWNSASPDWHTPRAQNDLKVGGEFSYRMEAKDGSQGFDFQGTYNEIKENELISYAMSDLRKVRINFTEAGGKTSVEVIFQPEKENPIEMQREGWQAILNNFKKYVESKD